MTAHIQVHRFNDRVCLSTGSGKSVYLNRDDARDLAKALEECQTDIFHIQFAKSQHSTFMMEIEDTKL